MTCSPPRAWQRACCGSSRGRPAPPPDRAGEGPAPPPAAPSSALRRTVASRSSVRRRLVPILCVAAGLTVGLGWLILRPPTPRLRTIVSGGGGPPTLVLLHGYGSSAEKWAPFTQTIWL